MLLKWNIRRYVVLVYIVYVLAVVLLETGEVYTFGSNQYGQLGVGDTGIRSVTPSLSILLTNESKCKDQKY